MRKKLKLFVWFVWFVVGFFNLHAQNSPYLVPRQIYVGDPATLVVPLPPAAHNVPDIVLTMRDLLSNENFYYPNEREKLSNETNKAINDTAKISNERGKLSNESIKASNSSLEINKVTYERRTAGSRLLIEFTAFSPGIIELPYIEIGGEFFSGFTVKVNSLLEAEAADPTGKARLLSGAAAVLAMPGTALMLYGSLTFIIAVILLAIWFIFKGRAVFKKLREKWKRYRLFAGMYSAEKRLTRALAKGVDKRIILDKISFEFREFLSILTGKNCRSMTAREFMREFNESAFLGEFFGICDKLRFSGTDIDPDSIEKLLSDLKGFLDFKKNEEKAK